MLCIVMSVTYSQINPVYSSYQADERRKTSDGLERFDNTNFYVLNLNQLGAI